eukprot:jgi/Tetstr1/447255/TSEL_034692.t1
MLDKSIGPSSSAPSVLRSADPRATGADPHDVVIRSSSVYLGEAISVSSSGQTVTKSVASTMIVTDRNIEDDLVSVETNRLTPGGLTDTHFGSGQIIDSKFTGVIPVSYGGTGLSTYNPDSLIIGNGPNEMATVDPVAFDPADGRLTIHATSIRFVDPDNSGDYFDLGMSDGVPIISNSTNTLASALTQESVGIAPAVSMLAVDSITDSNAVLAYDVVDEDVDQRSLYLSWYLKSRDYPRDPEEIIAGTDSVSHKAVDITGGGRSGTTLIDTLGPITEYVIRSVADDYRGNVSVSKSLQFQTTEFVEPGIVTVSDLVVESEALYFTASNSPDTSAMVAVAGTFVKPNAYAAINLWDALLTTGFNGLFVANISANAASNVNVGLTQYRDVADLSAAPQTIHENAMYYPFYLLVDAESNASLCNLSPIFNEVSVFWVQEPHFVAPYHLDSVTFAWESSNLPGLDLLSYLGSGPVSAETVLVEGIQLASLSNDGTPFSYLSGTGSPLEHTEEYTLSTVIQQGEGLCNLRHATGRTLDNVAPVFTRFDVSYSSSNPQVHYSAFDKSGITGVPFVVRTAPMADPEPSDVLDATDAIILAESNDTRVFDHIPSHCNAYIYATIQDRASEFGAATDLLADVRSAVQNVPAPLGNPVFYQDDDTHFVIAALNVVDNIPVQADAAVHAFLVLFPEGSVPATVPDLSNLVDPLFSPPEESVADTDAPAWIVPPFFNSNFHADGVEVAWHGWDSSGIETILTYVGSSLVTYDTLALHGEQHSGASNTGLKLSTNNETSGPIAHTSEYTVSVVAVDFSGLHNDVAWFAAKSLDNVAPTMDTFTVAYSGPDADISWAASDASGIAGVHLAQTSEPWNPTPQQVVDNADFVGPASGTTVLSGSPSWCNTYVFGAAEDKASEYGQPDNLLSAVSSFVLNAPSYVNATAFAQTSSKYEVTSTAFDVEADAGVTVYYTVFPHGSEPSTPDSHRTAVLGDTSSSVIHQ